MKQQYVISNYVRQISHFHHKNVIKLCVRYYCICSKRLFHPPYAAVNMFTYLDWQIPQ